MNDTFKRLRIALHKGDRLTGTVSGVWEIESGTVLVVWYEGDRVVIPADKDDRLKHPYNLIGTDIDFIVMAVNPGENVVAGCFEGRSGD